jgi:phosphoribosyl 1,2-cyclic phosphodiesterase
MLRIMAAAITVLASGSRGNCSVVSTSRTKILVDAGLSGRETLRRMHAAGEDPTQLSAILVSHEHSDHVSGVYQLSRKLKIPVYMTGGTHQEWRRCERDRRKDQSVLDRCEHFQAGRGFEIGDISVMPCTIPHDAADPVAFVFRAEGVKLGIVTDLGYMPASVMQHIRGCDFLMIESNHDLEMLRVGPYPWSVKQRVLSRLGHLSNDALAEFLTTDYDGGATYIVLAHLSEQNNHPEIARNAAERALAGQCNLLSNRLLLAQQAEPLESIRF